jgi:hypothetical protein
MHCCRVWKDYFLRLRPSLWGNFRRINPYTSYGARTLRLPREVYERRRAAIWRLSVVILASKFSLIILNTPYQ